MSFPSDIKNAMRDCILKLLWAKKDIYNFFQTNGCNSADMRTISNYKELKRYEIIDVMFAHLSSKADGGIGPYRAILQSLMDWSHFDPYYFNELGKLNKEDAIRSIQHLKQLQEIRDHKIKERRKNREQREQELQSAKIRMEDLKGQYISLLQGDIVGQKRGYALEELLQNLAKLSNLSVTTPFKINGEQIDGAIKFEGENYIIEAKWQDKVASNEPVYQFVGKVEGKFYGRGIFISINGFSENVVSSIVMGKAIKTIFVDGADLMYVLEGFLSFSEMLDKKVQAAQNKGKIYIDALSGKSKISS